MYIHSQANSISFTKITYSPTARRVLLCEATAVKQLMKLQEQKRTKSIILRVSEDEKKLIEENAKRTGYGVSVYLRNLGLGHEPTSKIDQKSVLDLLKVNADLARLGGLLKLWLSQEGFSDEIGDQPIKNFWNEVQEIKADLVDKVKQL